MENSSRCSIFFVNKNKFYNSIYRFLACPKHFPLLLTGSLLVYGGFKKDKSFSNHQDRHQAAHLIAETENQLYSVRFLLTIELIQKKKERE